MRTFLRFFTIAVSMLAAASFSFAANFPEGSPKFVGDLQTALKQAKESNKPVVAVFSASWCPPCQMMKQKVYPSDAVKAYHDQFIWAYIDVEEDQNAKDVRSYGVNVIPHFYFLNADGKTIDQQIGGSNADDFVKKLKGALKKAKKDK